MEIDYIEGKPIEIEDVEIIPWSLYMRDEVGSIEGYPSYRYTDYSVYIYSQIMQPQCYAELFHIIRSASLGDVINIFINSPGGDMTTLQAFGSIIEDTEAYVCCYVDGEASSAAFVLAFMGDETYLSEFCQIMSHNQHLTISRTDMANIKKYTDNSTDIYRKMLEKYCSKVLTKDEIMAICEDGREIHLSADVANERLKKWYEEHKADGEKKESELSESSDMKDNEHTSSE